MKTVIFDMGGVVLEDPGHIVWPKIARLTGKDQHELEQVFRDENCENSLADLDRGTINVRQFLRSFYSRIDLGIHTEEFEREFKAGFIPIEEIWEIILDLRGKVKLVMLTNHHTDWMDLWVEKYEIFSAFEHIFVSSDLGTRKPEPEIYCYALEHSNSEASKTFFIDDNPENLLTAQKLSIKTFLFHGPENISRLRQELDNFLKHEDT